MTRWAFAGPIVLLVSACAHGNMDPLDAVVVEPAGGSDCLDVSHHDAIPLVITNRSPRRVAFLAAERSGPPYVLHPYAFSIDFAEPRSDNSLGVMVLLEHYVPPKDEVRLGPGDRTQVTAYASLAPLPDYTGRVRAKVTDTRGRQHLSHELAVCAATETSASGR